MADKVPPGKHCNAKTRDGLCDELAGIQTPHEGFGRCWKHGGNSVMVSGAPLQLPTVDGLKSLVKKNQNDTQVFDLRREISIARGVGEYLQDMIMQEPETDAINSLLKTLNTFLGTTERLVGRLHEIEKGRKYIISVDDVKKVIEDIVAIIAEEVEDSELQQRILSRILENQLGGTTIIAPPENYKYAKEWYAAHDDIPPKRTEGEEIVHRLNMKTKEPIEVEAPERMSFKEFSGKIEPMPLDGNEP